MIDDQRSKADLKSCIEVGRRWVSNLMRVLEKRVEQLVGEGC
jgi:hypothetical protein